MERKIQKKYMDEGFGFPVILLNVPMIKIRGTWTPDVDLNALTKVLLHALAHKPARLTGNEVRFIRQHFEMTSQKFGERFGGVSHAAVLNWEKCANDPTNMAEGTEKDIRMFIVFQLSRDPRTLVTLYEELENRRSDKSKPVEISVSEAV